MRNFTRKYSILPLSQFCSILHHWNYFTNKNFLPLEISIYLFGKINLEVRYSSMNFFFIKIRQTFITKNFHSKIKFTNKTFLSFEIVINDQGKYKLQMRYSSMNFFFISIWGGLVDLKIWASTLSLQFLNISLKISANKKFSDFDEIWYGISRDIGAFSGVCGNLLSDKKILKFLFVEIEQNGK